MEEFTFQTPTSVFAVLTGPSVNTIRPGDDDESRGRRAVHVHPFVEVDLIPSTVVPNNVKGEVAVVPLLFDGLLVLLALLDFDFN